jgi:hypothetical protein
MKTFFLLREEQVCPIATLDVHVNVKNRQHAIDEYHYGPANPSEPEKHWEKLAEIWGIETKTAKTMMCGNCAAFDVSDKMRSCIEKGIKGEEDNIDAMATIDKADLGYCNLLHFKCAGTRTCSLWLTNGPIDNKDLS